MKQDLSYLQNGTDIRGIALHGIINEEVNLTPSHAKLIGASFAKWLKSKTNKSTIKIAVGHDSRLSAFALKQSLIGGIINENCTVFDCGLASTPAMFMSTIIDGIKADGAIMITASHLPFNRNGFKFFTNEGGLEKDHIRELLLLIENLDFAETSGNTLVQSKTLVTNFDLISKYSELLVNKIKVATGEEKPLINTKIVVDAGNGAGGFFAEKVLIPLGANIEGSQFLEPDGSFPNHIPNPEDKEAMLSIKKCVLENKADFGIIFDTDVDRAAIVGPNGEIINRNKLIALISNIVLEQYPNTTIVTDSVTSDGLTTYIESLGGIHHRFKRGYKNVINEAIRLNESNRETHLAIETSGHAAFKENYFLDDGAYIVVKLLIKMVQLKKEGLYLHDLISSLNEPLSTEEIRIKINSSNFTDYGNKVIESFKNYTSDIDGWNIVPNNYEGVRISCTNQYGWCLMRLSLHDPVLSINIESDLENGSDIIKEDLIKFLNNYDKLEI